MQDIVKKHLLTLSKGFSDSNDPQSAALNNALLNTLCNDKKGGQSAKASYEELLKQLTNKASDLNNNQGTSSIRNQNI